MMLFLPSPSKGEGLGVIVCNRKIPFAGAILIALVFLPEGHSHHSPRLPGTPGYLG